MRIGVDLGGTKIEAIAIADDGTTRARRRVLTPRHDYDATLDAIAGLITAIEDQAGAGGSVGVGIPGSISAATGLVKNANSTWLNGRALDVDLSARVNRPLRFANDANCFALSEAIDGAAAGARVVFGVIIGTGTGGGLVVDGRLVDGANGIAGEWGHNPMPWPRDGEWPGPACYCGRTGCLETFLSGPAVARDYRSRGGDSLSAEEIAGRASGGERLARHTLECHAERLGRALASIINVVDPDVLVLGGGLSNIDALYADVPRHWQPYVFSDGPVVTRVARARHGDSSGVRGAAWLW